MTDGRITQGARIAVGGGDSDARLTQGVRLAIGQFVPPSRITQAVRLTIGGSEPPVRITQAVRLVVGQGVACVTHWQQLWKITRRDGVVFRFTSLDEDFIYGGQLYQSCSSLMPSANEESSVIGSVGNMELTGIVSDDGISEDELYGGKFDDAYVEVWLVAYQGTESPRRLAAGWTGNLSHDVSGFKLEVTGVGAKLDQQSITQVYAPACRWVFGDAHCTVDLEALKATGEVTAVANRGAFTTDATDPGNGSQWENGVVVWLTGRNAGDRCETKTVDFGTGDVVLWALCAYEPQPGDTFKMLPGCDLSSATCKNVYSNLLNFGGYDKVPGNDQLAQTPDSKYT